jgi:hypothetical protein
MRMLLFAIAAVGIFTVFSAVFAASADARSVRLLPKWLWVVLCVLVTPIGGIFYILVGRPIGGPSSGGQGTAKSPKAPDDDPDFLRKLAERLKRDGEAE